MYNYKETFAIENEESWDSIFVIDLNTLVEKPITHIPKKGKSWQINDSILYYCFHEHLKRDIWNTDQWGIIYLTPYPFYRRSYLSANKLIAYSDALSMSCFDICYLNEKNIKYYFRDQQAFCIFSFDQTADRFEEWSTDNVYTRVKYSKKHPPFVYAPSEYKNHIVFNAVKDLDFFQGDFKVIIQNDSTYIFNLLTGRIYLIDKKKIRHIGTIELTDDYPELFGNKLLIEDRDNHEVIVFAPIRWEKTKLKKPTMRVMSEEEMKEKWHPQQETLLVYLENDTADYCVNLVFENPSTDTIFIANRYKHQRDIVPYKSSLGIMINFHKNKEPIGKVWDYAPLYFEISKDYGDRIPIYPLEKIKLNIALPWLYSENEIRTDEYGIDINISWKYVNRSKRLYKNACVTTNYLKLE
ncbi:hypothetical protein [Bacteroides sp. 224]|uniref:hypothetical protein n=1 Tax=Bacteroides sp. 224 TaxID=2302936 RepID=UPI0013D390BC|nr:hypothetical protein [Bacteroides sp. 224]